MRNISRRGFVKALGGSAVVLASGLIIPGCAASGGSSSNSSGDAEDPEEVASTGVFQGVDLSDWDAVCEAARGSKVSIAGSGYNVTFTSYMNEIVVPDLKKEYDIDVEWVTFETEAEVIQLVNEEKAAGKPVGQGTYDLLWVTSDESYFMQERGSLYADTRKHLPCIQYMDPDIVGLVGYEDMPLHCATVPYGPLIWTYVYNSDYIEWTPKNAAEYLEWVKEYKGKTTYSNALDYGWGTWWPLVCDILGENWTDQLGPEPVYEEAVEIMQPAIEFLRECNPYLWNKGQSYPTYDQNYDLYPSGETWAMQIDTPYLLDSFLKLGTFPESSRCFYFDDLGAYQMWGNQLAIAYNAPNFLGAMVALEGIMKPEAMVKEVQATGYCESINYDRLTDEQKKLWDALSFDERCPQPEEVREMKRVPHIPFSFYNMVAEIWENEIKGKYND